MNTDLPGTTAPNDKQSDNGGRNKSNNQNRGRIILAGLTLFFVIPAIAAKLILTQHWYQSGVTNKGQLIEPRTTYRMIGVTHNIEKSWHLGYLVPEKCDVLCQKQIHLLLQSHTALGKYQHRVTAVLFLADNSDKSALNHLSATKEIATIEVNETFLTLISSSEYLLTDPLGQLVMKYPLQKQQALLIKQHKALLADFRKLLKLSRVG